MRDTPTAAAAAAVSAVLATVNANVCSYFGGRV